MTAFGENLRRIRTERKMTQDEFANLLNTSKQVISRYETGQRSPKVSVVSEYAEILGVSISDLTRSDSSQTEEDELLALREQLRNDPDRLALLDLATKGKKSDVRQVAALIDALRATNPDFYDGDDPA